MFFPQSRILECFVFYGGEVLDFLSMTYFDVAPAAVLGRLIHNLVLHTDLMTGALTIFFFSVLFHCPPLSFHILS